MPYHGSSLSKVLEQIYTQIGKGGDVSPLLALLEMRLNKFKTITKHTTKVIW